MARDLPVPIDPVADVRRGIDRLPREWHGSGSVPSAVLDALERHASGVQRSMETGTGRTTLLLSHLSAHHTVFTKDDTGDGDSLQAVRTSPLLNRTNVHFVVGPTQRTVLAHHFDARLELAFLDGPHAYPFPELEYWAVYPHISTGGVLAIDDIQIPTIGNMFQFLRADAMWELLEVVDSTAFFRRTAAALIDPFGEGWTQQDYNRRSRLAHLPLTTRVKRRVRAALTRAASDRSVR